MTLTAMLNVYLLVTCFVAVSLSSDVKSEFPAVERRMLLIPPGDSADSNSLHNSNDNSGFQPEPRSSSEEILTPQQLLATLHQIRQKQNEAPERTLPDSMSMKMPKSSNELPLTIPTDYSYPNSQNPAIAIAQQKPQGLSTTWKFLLQVIKDITTNLRPTAVTNQQKEDNTAASQYIVEPPKTAIRENINNVAFEEERESVTQLIGAILGRYECRKHAICKAGKYMGKFRGKNIVLLFLEKWAPDSWTETLRVAKSAAIYGDSCEKFYCPIPE